MKCDICGICGLSFQKHFGNIFGSITIDQFFKLLKTFHKIYSAKILKLPDILSVYYLQATDLLSRSIWEKYSAKIFGRSTHLAERIFTGTKCRRFKDGIPARLQNLTLQYYTFSSVVLFCFLFFCNHFLSHSCFHCPLFVMFPAYLKLVMQRKRIQQGKPGGMQVISVT